MALSGAIKSAKFSSIRAYAEAKDFTLPRRSPSDCPVAVWATLGPHRPAVKPPNTIISGTSTAERVFIGLLEFLATRQALGLSIVTLEISRDAETSEIRPARRPKGRIAREQAHR